MANKKDMPEDAVLVTEEPAAAEDPSSLKEVLEELKAEQPAMPLIKDQKTILALKTRGHIPLTLTPKTVERGGERKTEIMVQFPDSALSDYEDWKRGSREGSFAIIRDHDQSIEWWRSIVHNKPTP